MTLVQNLSLNLVQNLTFKIGKIGPEPNLTACNIYGNSILKYTEETKLPNINILLLSCRTGSSTTGSTGFWGSWTTRHSTRWGGGGEVTGRDGICPQGNLHDLWIYASFRVSISLSLQIRAWSCRCMLVAPPRETVFRFTQVNVDVTASNSTSYL